MPCDQVYRWLEARTRACGIEAVAPTIQHLRNANCGAVRRQTSYWRRYTLNGRHIWFEFSLDQNPGFFWRASKSLLEVVLDAVRPMLYPLVLLRDLGFCLDDVLTIAWGGEEGTSCLKLGSVEDEILTRFLGGTLYVCVSMLLSAGTLVMVGCGSYDYFPTIRLILNIGSAVLHNVAVLYIVVVRYGISGEVLTGFSGGNMLLCHSVGVMLSLFYCLASYPQELHWASWLPYPVQWTWRLFRLGLNRFFVTTSVTRMAANIFIAFTVIVYWHYMVIMHDSASLLSFFFNLPKERSGCHELVDCNSSIPSWGLCPFAVFVALHQRNFSYTFRSWRTKSSAFMAFVSYLWWGAREWLLLLTYLVFSLLLDDQVLDTPLGGSHTAASVIAYCGATNDGPALSFQLDGVLSMVGFVVMALIAYSALKQLVFLTLELMLQYAVRLEEVNRLEGVMPAPAWLLYYLAPPYYRCVLTFAIPSTGRQVNNSSYLFIESSCGYRSRRDRLRTNDWATGLPLQNWEQTGPEYWLQWLRGMMTSSLWTTRMVDDSLLQWLKFNQKILTSLRLAVGGHRGQRWHIKWCESREWRGVWFLFHTPNDVAAQRIPVFTWTGVISTNDRILKQVLEDRSKSIADGRSLCEQAAASSAHGARSRGVSRIHVLSDWGARLTWLLRTAC